MVLLHGFAMRPATYARTAELLAERTGVRVLVPDLFSGRGSWRYPRVLDGLRAALDRRGLGEVTMVGHSFGGGIQLGLAAAEPGRVVDLVFSDTLAVSHQWGLADEALSHPAGILGLATPQAASAFGRSWMTHPRRLAQAAWWAFRADRDGDIDAVAAARLPAHVLWANRDSILSCVDGREFARRLGATFTVARSQDGPVDHDWMFQDPELFVDHLQRLGLRSLPAVEERA